MEPKTKVHAEAGKQEYLITREFDLPVHLLFKAHVDPDIVAQVMGTKVLSFEAKKNGSYRFETTDPQGKVIFQAAGVIHELIPDKKIIRTFEMGNTPFGVQLEIYDFEKLSDETSKLTMHVIYESVAQRDQVLQIGLTWGINMAHDRIQEIAGKLK
ncbi:MAG TPA: SRPBCC domain-containing protein [Puia sp.]|nr:SRPBCC domain-containing protein [Puia sp.]